MSLFPPDNWEVRNVADFETLTVPAPTGSKYHLQALLVGKPAHGREGQFKFLISGNDHYKIEMRVDHVINDEAFKGMTIVCQLALGSQIVLGVNSSTSRWVDVVELIQSQDADVLDEEGESVLEEFLLKMEEFKKKTPNQPTGKIYTKTGTTRNQPNYNTFTLQAFHGGGRWAVWDRTSPPSS